MKLEVCTQRVAARNPHDRCQATYCIHFQLLQAALTEVTFELSQASCEDARNIRTCTCPLSYSGNWPMWWCTIFANE